MKVVTTPKASKDLEDWIGRIAARNPRAAESFLGRIRKCIEVIRIHPQAGHKHPRRRNVRKWIEAPIIYWEIAQTMVRDWIQRMLGDPPFAREHNQIETKRFREALWEEIQKAIARSSDERYVKLRQAIDSGLFQLTEDRIRRTLSFLTHSGWVYWNERLFEERVIIGQKWALDGIYTLLDRRRNRPIYRELRADDGQFTLSQLGERCWNAAGYSKTEQELLLSLMERCQLCFKLRSASEAWREEDIFVSFEHLPKAKESSRLPVSVVSGERNIESLF